MIKRAIIDFISDKMPENIYRICFLHVSTHDIFSSKLLPPEHRTQLKRT